MASYAECAIQQFHRGLRVRPLRCRLIMLCHPAGGGAHESSVGARVAHVARLVAALRVRFVLMAIRRKEMP